jgi:hypothetical protein
MGIRKEIAEDLPAKKLSNGKSISSYLSRMVSSKKARIRNDIKHG